jgi:hypothetical protein
MKLVRSLPVSSVAYALMQGVSLLALTGTMLQAQAAPVPAVDRGRVVIVYQEPRHRVVRDEGDIKMLDIQMLPGDSTLYHTHDSPILYNMISGGAGPTGSASSNTRYLTEPITHKVGNPGPHLFQIVAMASYGPGEADLTASPPDGLTGEACADERPANMTGSCLEIENNWFRAYRVDLAPGQQTPVYRHRHDVSIVLFTPGSVQVTKENGFGAELEKAAGPAVYTWREAEQPYTIKNVGSAPVSLFVNEARRPR